MSGDGTPEFLTDSHNLEFVQSPTQNINFQVEAQSARIGMTAAITSEKVVRITVISCLQAWEGMLDVAAQTATGDEAVESELTFIFPVA